jgi:hypothetical protein
MSAFAVLRLIKEHGQDIRRAWHAHFGRRGHPRSKNGFRLLIDGRKRFLAFELFPWFRAAASTRTICLPRLCPS